MTTSTTNERIVHKVRRPRRMPKVAGRRQLFILMVNRNLSENKMGDVAARETKAFEDRVAEQRIGEHPTVLDGNGRISFAPF